MLTSAVLGSVHIPPYVEAVLLESLKEEKKLRLYRTFKQHGQQMAVWPLHSLTIAIRTLSSHYCVLSSPPCLACLLRILNINIFQTITLSVTQSVNQSWLNSLTKQLIMKIITQPNESDLRDLK